MKYMSYHVRVTITEHDSRIIW